MSSTILLFIGISVIILYVLILVEVYVYYRFEKDLLNGKLSTDKEFCTGNNKGKRMGVIAK